VEHSCHVAESEFFKIVVRSPIGCKKRFVKNHFFRKFKKSTRSGSTDIVENVSYLKKNILKKQNPKDLFGAQSERFKVSTFETGKIHWFLREKVRGWLKVLTLNRSNFVPTKRFRILFFQYFSFARAHFQLLLVNPRVSFCTFRKKWVFDETLFAANWWSNKIFEKINFLTMM